MKKILFYLIMLMSSSARLYAQTKLINGTVSGIESEATIHTTSNPSAQVKITKGTFSISSRLPGDTLIIEATGYQSMRIPVNASTVSPLLIDMSPALKALQEVVVNTGYQKIAKERATGSFTIIDNKLLNQQVGTTVLDKLEAVSNGLYIDRQTGAQGRPKIIIRGLSTINGPSSPLIILDDFPYEGDLNNINPNDVETITILKDAAAASIWGTRAGNGVIVITTKRGRFNQPMKLEFTSNATILNKPDLRSISNISPADFIGVERFLYDKGYFNPGLSSTPWKAVSPVVELFYLRDKGKITSQEAESRIAALGQYNLTDQLLDHVYEKGLNLQQSLSLSGGSRNMSWSLAGGWDRNSDQLDNKYNRYNFRSAQTFRITPRIEMTTVLDYTQSESIQGRQGAGLSSNTGLLPVYTRLRGDNGEALPVNIDYRQRYADSAGAGKLLDWSYYPLTDADHIHSKSREQAVFANIGANYTVLKGLSVGVKYQYGRQVISGLTSYDEGSYLVRNYINTFSSRNTQGDIVYNFPRGSVLYNRSGIIETQNFRGQATFGRTLGRHEINAIAGGEWRHVEADNISTSEIGFNPDLLVTSTQLDGLHPYKNFLTGGNEYLPLSRVYSGTANVNISFFGNAAYTYNRKYTVSASVRRDASNLFGATKNSRWNPLASGGLAWDISQENFYHIRWMPLLKFRGTYGVSGNADPLRAAVTTLKPQGPSIYTNVNISQIAQYENKNLGWEKVAMMNLAVDFGMFNNRLSGSIEYYHKKASNLFGFAEVDPTGISVTALEKNIADMKGHGVDILLNSKNIIGAFSWSSQLNLNFNRDRITNYLRADQSSLSFLGGGISGIKGRPVYAVYTFKWAGLDPLTGDPQGYLNGQVSKDYAKITTTGTTPAQLVYSGPVLPTAVLSLGNTISWKKLYLTVRITGKFGHYFRRSSINYNNLFRSRIGHADFAQRWQKPGDEKFTNVPSMLYPVNSDRDFFYSQSEALVEKADHIRLQYINLGYDFKKVQVYINANNLGILWRANKLSIDPEYNSSYPPATNIAIGMRATF